MGGWSQVVCRYYRGTIEEFELRVNEIQGVNKFAKEYCADIKKVKMLMGANEPKS